MQAAACLMKALRHQKKTDCFLIEQTVRLYETQQSCCINEYAAICYRNQIKFLKCLIYYKYTLNTLLCQAFLFLKIKNIKLLNTNQTQTGQFHPDARTAYHLITLSPYHAVIILHLRFCASCGI